jgi:hypothetical protein
MLDGMKKWLRGLRSPKRLLITLGVLALGGLAIYVAVVRPIQVRMEKARFERAATELEGVYEQIVSIAGKPDDVKRKKSCDYASRVFENGPLGCLVRVSLLYAEKDSSSANNILGSVRSKFDHPVVGQSVSRNYFIAYGDATAKSAGPVNQILAQRLDIGGVGLSCGLEYIYPANPKYEQIHSVQSQENIEIIISCTGDAMAPYYTVE